MLHVGKEVKRSSEEVLQEAVDFFGPGGVGLDMTVQTANSVRFEGGGGHVQVQMMPRGDGVTEIDIQTQEWDYQVRQFLQEV